MSTFITQAEAGNCAYGNTFGVSCFVFPVNTTFFFFFFFFKKAITLVCFLPLQFLLSLLFS